MASPDPGIGFQAANACALLSSSEISEVIGLRVESGVRDDSGIVSNGAYSSTCTWIVEPLAAVASDRQAPLGGRSFVILNVMTWPPASERAHTFLQAFRDAAGAGDIPAQPVPRDYGDEALWWGDGLAVRKGDISFGISVFVPSLAAAAPGHSPGHFPGHFEEQLAVRILDRLSRGSGGE